jgi:hypothetical protein
MTNEEFIVKFLDINQPMEQSPTRFSTLALLLRGARKLSGRNLSTGIYERNELNEENFKDQTYFSLQFTGLVDYLILLEQIGSIFKPKHQPLINRTNGIYCALSYFTALGDMEKKAIQMLRNSLTHKFGLATEKSPTTKLPMKFTIDRNRDPRIIVPPLRNWNGAFSDKLDDSSTTVFLFDLLDLVEDVYQKVVLESKNRNLDLVLTDGIDELKARYTII